MHTTDGHAVPRTTPPSAAGAPPPNAGVENAVRVLVADDSALYRSGLVRAIAASSDLELVADVDGGRPAVAAASELRPDVVVIDYRMPDLDGWSAAMQMRAEQPDLRIVLMSAYGDELADRLARLQEPTDAGTLDAVLDKASSRREILDRVRSLARTA